jgi:uncharacterized protein (TIGR03085 family)
VRHNTNRLSLAQQERQALCDLLNDLGPDAPTLCLGWRSADLAAHLLVRDRRPDSMPGAVLRLNVLQEWTNHVRDGVRDTLTWDELIAQLRAGPPAPIRPLDGAMNTIEFFVHHEDVRRAQPGWEPSTLADEAAAELWKRLNAMSFATRLLSSLGRQPPVSRVEVPGRPPIVLVSQHGLGRSQSARPKVLRGQAGEAVLWVMGRQGAARVELSEAAG